MDIFKMWEETTEGMRRAVTPSSVCVCVCVCVCDSPERLHWALLALWVWWSWAACPTSGDAAGLWDSEDFLSLLKPANIRARRRQGSTGSTEQTERPRHSHLSAKMHSMTFVLINHVGQQAAGTDFSRCQITSYISLKTSGWRLKEPTRHLG